jgi:hypothetical protein
MLNGATTTYGYNDANEPQSGLSSGEHQPRNQRRRLFLHGRDGVRVGIERDRDGRLTEVPTARVHVRSARV